MNPLQQQGIEIPEPMLDILRQGFEEYGGAVLPKGMRNNAGVSQDNETGRECLHNKEHIEDFVSDSTSVIDMVRLGMAYAERLKEYLQKATLRGRFRMIISARSADRTCVMRFHRVRTGQPWLDLNLENYKEEAIMTADFEVTPDGF